MAKSTQEIVFEGWLTKSPPSKRIWRARWRRRWFLLTNSGELPGQYILTYYTDRNCRQKKGVINLDQCEQVDLGLKLDERKLKLDHVFDIKTPSRTYYLAADTETEMKNWVTCICKVCGLKSTNDEEEARISTGDIEITEESSDNNRRNTVMNNFNQTPPVSPVSTSPYIPIFECITGKSPVFDPKDFKTLMEYNKKNSISTTDNLLNHVMQTNNETYELTQRRNSQLNYINLPNDPRFYDCPRKLAPHHSQQLGQKQNEHDYTNLVDNIKNHSPLQSPTDSDSVFNDEHWVNNMSSDLNSANTRPSDNSADEVMVATQKFTKATKTTLLAPPPRPPKPSQRSPAPCYLNLTPTNTKDSEDSDHEKLSKESTRPLQAKVLTDDMYDFPRSHHIESEATLRKKQHCYNNAAPVPCPEGTIFRYDISPKPGTSTIAFRYDLEDLSQDIIEPPSPAHSHSSSTPAYSNLPSPLLASTQLMPPPAVNRELKPRRKLSDSHSISSNPEPQSPRNVTGPSVDRKLKPPTPLQEAHMRKNFATDDDPHRRIRAAPSPTPNLGHSHDSLLTKKDYGQMYQYLGKMQYLDLDLENTTSYTTTNKPFPLKNQQDTVYKEVDFMKTQAFNITRNLLEKERQEPPKKENINK